MKIWTSLCLVAVLASGATVERQLEHPWGRWQPGAWVETRTSTRELPEGLVERCQLVGFRPDGVELESTLASPTGEDVRVGQRQGWAFGGFAHVLPSARRVGEETLSVEGRPLACEVWEASWQQEGETFVARSWLDEGHELPVRLRVASPKGGYELTLAKRRDWVRMGERKLPAARYEGNGKSKGSTLRLVQWMSLDVPGGVLRCETEATQAGTRTTLVREVTAFRCEPLAAR